MDRIHIYVSGKRIFLGMFGQSDGLLDMDWSNPPEIPFAAIETEFLSLILEIATVSQIRTPS